MFHKVTSVASLTVLSEVNVSLWASDLGGRPLPGGSSHNCEQCDCLLAYPNWDLSLSATDLGHRSVSDEVIRLLCCSCWWQDWIEIQRRYKKGEVLLVCTGTQSVHMVKCVLANCRAQSKWNRRSSIMSKPLVISLRFCLQDEIHQSKVYGTVKNELWKIFILRCYFVIIVFFVSGTHQQRLMQSVNFSYPCCIGNTSAPLHLLLRSWLLKVDSKHRLCWLSACLYIRTQIVGRLTACCCQSNKSYPLWPHLPVNAVELWTVMSFIWAVCHRHFLSQVPPLRRPPSVPTLYVFFFPMKRKSYPETPCFPS